jgi:hypothetical protein
MRVDKSAKKYYRTFFLKDKACRETETVFRRSQNQPSPFFIDRRQRLSYVTHVVFKKALPLGEMSWRSNINVPDGYAG